MQMIPKLALLAVLAGICFAIPVVILFNSHARLRQDNQELRNRADQLFAENQRFSNVLNRLSVAQTTASTQLQELLRLRDEVTQLGQENALPSLAAQPDHIDQLLALDGLEAAVEQLIEQTEEFDLLRDEINELREEIRQGRLIEVSPPLIDDPVAPPIPDDEPPDLALRVIRTQGETFAEKLKRSVGAGEDETFQEVFDRFLQSNGIQANTVAAAVFDERTGRVIVRAPQSTLDQIEDLTSALEEAP